MAKNENSTGNKNSDIVKKVYEYLDYSYEAFKTLQKEIKDDFRFVQGEQWDPSDVQTLGNRGVKALTINKIKPIIKLITGIERQSRSDQKAYPEGGEDQITADISTRLLKNTSKLSKVEVKQSEQFKSGSIGGICYLEPYMDYTYDLIHGSLKFKKLSALDAFPDPDAKEYDLSDGKFFCKVTRSLTKDELKELFPEQEKKIEELGIGTVNWDDINVNIVQIETGEDYDDQGMGYKDKKKGIYDLVECYYKEMTKKYFVAIPEQGLIEEMPGKKEAEATVEQLASQGAEATVITKMIPVIRHARVVGPELMTDEVAWSYPAWKYYHFMPFWCEHNTEEIGGKEILIQGIVRTIKDLQEEFNKRRTQELQHLNSSSNSGFIVKKNALDDQNLSRLKTHGSSPGLVIEADDPANVSRITPMPLSQGHAQLAAENQQDLKEASGVNPDLLASDSKSQSGRAILLKQRQGLSMIQEMLDNFSETKRLIGQFMLSQLKEIYTVDSAMKVLGDAWIAENFTVPINIVLGRALAKEEQGGQLTDVEERVVVSYPNADPRVPVQDEDGNLATMVDMDSAIQTVNKVLNDSELGKYDVAIGEGPYAETIRMANFLDLKELATQGMPIPPEVLIEMSLIPEGQKKSIKEALAAQQQALAAQQQVGGQ